MHRNGLPGLILIMLLAASLACNLTAESTSGNPTPVSLIPAAGSNQQPIEDEVVVEDSVQDDASDASDTNSNDIPVLNLDEEPVSNNTQNTGSSSGNNGTGTSNGSGSSAPVNSCIPRTDWGYTYQVVQGDTLSNIARRADTTANTLAIGNCLADPNRLEVGQVLRVPQYPYYVPNIGPLTVTPGEILGSGSSILTVRVAPGTRLSVHANVDAAERVEFYTRDNSNNGQPRLIMTDYNLRDGGHMTWDIPQTSPGAAYIWAEAVYANGQERVDSREVLVRWETPQQQAAPQLGGIVIDPSKQGTDGNIYIEAGQTVSITVAAVNAESVSFYTAPTGTGMSGTLQGVIVPDDGVASLVFPTMNRNGNMHLWAEAVNNTGQVATTEIYMLIIEENCTTDWFFQFEDRTPSECPTPVESVQVIAQDFEGGRVFRYPITTTDGNVYYFVAYNNGKWDAFADTWDGTPVDNSDFTAPADRLVPTGGIGHLWRNNETLRADLGWAYTPAEEFMGRAQTYASDTMPFRYPAPQPGWLMYVDYGKEGLVLALSEVSAANGGRTWFVVGSY